MQGMTIEHIISLCAIVSLDHDRYPGMKIPYLAGDATLVNCDLLQLSGLLTKEDTCKHALGIPCDPLYIAVANRVSNTPTNPPLAGRPAPHPPEPPKK